MSAEVMSGDMEILLLAEAADRCCTPLALELAGLARGLFEGAARVVALAPDALGPDAFAALIARGADVIHTLPDPYATGLYESDVWLAGVDQILATRAPRLVLAGHTALGADLAPRLAARRGVALATGCERLAVRDGTIVATRACYGNNAREVLRLLGAPAVATIKAKTQPPAAAARGRTGTIETLAPCITATTGPRVVARQHDDPGAGPALETARVIVAGGRGVGGPAGFALLEDLARVLGGAVGASRVACDLGWVPQSRQIGLTGKTVTPELYIAVGISGASHHMAGCGNARTIVAVNSDPSAPIFKEAHFGIVGDFQQIVPALREAVEQRARSTPP